MVFKTNLIFVDPIGSEQVVLVKETSLKEVKKSVTACPCDSFVVSNIEEPRFIGLD